MISHRGTMAAARGERDTITLQVGPISGGVRPTTRAKSPEPIRL
jgi:hypothetical protein